MVRVMLLVMVIKEVVVMLMKIDDTKTTIPNGNGIQVPSLRKSA